MARLPQLNSPLGGGGQIPGSVWKEHSYLCAQLTDYAILLISSSSGVIRLHPVVFGGDVSGAGEQIQVLVNTEAACLPFEVSPGLSHLFPLCCYFCFGVPGLTLGSMLTDYSWQGFLSLEVEPRVAMCYTSTLHTILSLWPLNFIFVLIYACWLVWSGPVWV